MIKVSSTNSVNKGEPSVVRVYKDGVKIAEVFVTKRSPLSYLKSLKRSKHFLSLERQLLPHGVSLSDVGLGKEQRL